MTPECLHPYKATARLIDGLLEFWPQHEKFISDRFSMLGEEELESLEVISAQITQITGGQFLPLYEGYKWMCGAVFVEEVHFRRHGSYRLSSFDEAYREVYSKPEIMGPYMKGLLLSQVVWNNHAQVIELFKKKFLLYDKPAKSYLEVGPGHGLYLSSAISYLSGTRIEAWDISEQSIEETRDCLSRLSIPVTSVNLVTQDLFDARSTQKWDRIVFSEILEHIEDTDAAMTKLRSLLSDEGVLFLNVPVNSPAPDHISNWESPEHLQAFVEGHGFVCQQHFMLPGTGFTLERARETRSAISCVMFLSAG